MTEGKQVEIKQAKGRPLLTWVGKQPLRYVTAFPAQHIESFLTGDIETDPQIWRDWPDTYPKGGLLFHGDNKEVLAHLLANGYRERIDLIYIDPPFNTGVNYIRKVSLRGVRMEKIEGEGYSLSEQIQYENSWHTDVYLQSLYERLQLAKELLTANGTIVIRLDVHFGYYIRMLGDEIFGRDNFQNEIIVNRIKKNVTNKGRRTIPHAVDYLYVYFKSNETEYKNVLKELPETKPGYWHGMDSPGIPGPRELTLGGKVYYPAPGTHLKFTQAQAEGMWNRGELRENPTSGNLEYWVSDKDFENLDSNWTDIPGYSFSSGYPTENSEVLLERVVLACSKPGDLVMDFYLGSGTTAAIAQKLGRRWIGCDINKGSIQTTSKRLQNIIQEQYKKYQTLQAELPELEDVDTISPAQLSFAVYRVNDYDLQIQHNEAVELACEHVGIQRTRKDAFFDGTHGKKLAKIIPFNHPCTMLDLEEIKLELQARPEEDRDITIVCLGKETAVGAWLEEWNRLRGRGDVPNKINVIELRTDPRYGKFFIHKPATAKVTIERKDDKIIVEIEDFISPSIIERLKSQAGILSPQIDDWRSMVDTVMIDTAYDGEIFKIETADVPKKKVDLVVGKYQLESPRDKTTVAVKITDMLGEEVLVTRIV